MQEPYPRDVGKYRDGSGTGKNMKEEDFLKEVELIKEDVSEFKVRYSACQYFHERARHFSRDQLDKAVKLFNQMMGERFSDKE